MKTCWELLWFRIILFATTTRWLSESTDNGLYLTTTTPIITETRTSGHQTSDSLVTNSGVREVPKALRTTNTDDRPGANDNLEDSLIHLTKNISLNRKDEVNSGITGRDPSEWLNITLPLFSYYQFNLSATNRFLATDVTKFICGTKQLCNHTRGRESGPCTALCNPCHCDEMCHFYGDCCPDLLFSNSPVFPSTPFPHVSCSKEYWAVWGNFSDILMVSTCPSDANPVIAEQCERVNKYDQDSATPVSVWETQLTYRNIFCAQCHNASDPKAWGHRVGCKTNTSLNTARSKADLWSRVLADENCRIQSYPPHGVTPRRCFHPDVGTCAKNSDPVIEKLCLSFTNTVDYYGDDSFPNKYKNIFCAVCNGERLYKSKVCVHQMTATIPNPLNVLLDFRPKSRDPRESVKKIQKCPNDQAFDPFSNICRNITCSEGRILKDEICWELDDYGHIRGYLLDVTLLPVNLTTGIRGISLFKEMYVAWIDEKLKTFQKVFITSMVMSFYTREDETSGMAEEVELVTVSGKVISHIPTNSTNLEKTLSMIMSRDFTYNASGMIITLSSRPHFCPRPFGSPAGMKMQKKELILGPKYPEHRGHPPSDNVTYEVIPLSCPFVEYANRFEENFTFDPQTNILEFEVYSFSLHPNEFRCCGRVLKICVDTIANMTRVTFGDMAETSRDDEDLALSIVSLVCISLSLASLFLTFLIYCAIPKRRTLPGKISMALIFHLFCSHLLFLTTSNRTTNVVLCRVFGVLLHYFWMATFTWMLLSAYHMYTVFTSIRAHVSDYSADMKRLITFFFCALFIPTLIITACLVTHAVQSQGYEIGYGGTICFLDSPFAIGVFFVAPLALILLLNAGFFVKTILAIRSVPDIKEASNMSKKQHVFVYIRLSVLFGFTWIFGILATVLESTILQYAFVILTGSQGVMIFVAYCVNKRTLVELKTRIYGDDKMHTILSSDNKYKYSHSKH